MVTLHEVITFLVSMQISISSLQTQNVNRRGRSRHLARKLSLRRKRSSPNVFEMAATETITSIILIKLIRVSLGTVRHPRRFKIVVIDIQITLKQMLRDFIGIRDNRAKKSGMVNITSSVNSRERSGINTILHELDRKSGSAGMPRPISYAVFCLTTKTLRGHVVDPLDAVLRVFDYVGFFFDDTPTTDIYTLSLHDALPIYNPETNA